MFARSDCQLFRISFQIIILVKSLYCACVRCINRGRHVLLDAYNWAGFQCIDRIGCNKTINRPILVERRFMSGQGSGCKRVSSSCSYAMITDESSQKRNKMQFQSYAKVKLWRRGDSTVYNDSLYFLSVAPCTLYVNIVRLYSLETHCKLFCQLL